MSHPPIKKLFQVVSMPNGSLQWEMRWSLWIEIRLESHLNVLRREILSLANGFLQEGSRKGKGLIIKRFSH